MTSQIPRDDDQLIENQGVNFAMYCDIHGLGWREGVELAEKVSGEIEAAAALRDHPDLQAEKEALA